MSILGNRVLRKEDPKFLTVGGRYVADLDLPGVASITYVRSTYPHARITGIDLEDARSAPGVIDVVSSADVELAPMPLEVPFLNPSMRRTLLATDTVRFVGEPVVAIVSETREQGMDAAELVAIDYEPHAVVDDVERSRDGETLL